MPAWPEPFFDGSVPLARNCALNRLIQPIEVSSSETSTTPPSPVCWRRISKLTTPSAAHSPQPMSTIDGPTRTGAPPGSPTTLMMPPKACISGS